MYTMIFHHFCLNESSARVIVVSQSSVSESIFAFWVLFYHLRLLLLVDNIVSQKLMTTHEITLYCIQVTSLTTTLSSMHFLIEILFILKAIKSHFQASFHNIHIK